MTSLANIQALLLPGLRGLTGRYAQIPTQWSGVFDQGISKMTVERTAEMRYLGLAAIKTEGAATVFDNASGQRYIYSQEHLELGLGYSMTRKSIDDNLYKEQFNPSNLGLMDSFKQTKEIEGATVLNTATTYNAAIGGDGVALCSTAHPVDGGTWANRPSVDQDLNETSLTQALTAIRYFPTQANLRVFARGRKLLVPPQLEWTAERLLRSELRPDTANNDVGVLVSTKALPEDYQVMDFLTSNFAWFVLTDKKGLLFLQRIPFETDMQVDPVTGNLLVMGYERYSFAYNDPRAIYGSFPSS